MDEQKARRGMYAKIAIARKQLPHLSDDAVYRDMLQAEFGKRSAADLTQGQLARLVQFLAKAGASFTSTGNNKKIKAQSRPDWIAITDEMPHAGMKKQILAIWKKLGYDMGSLETRCARQFGTSVFVWVQDYNKLHALLTDLQKREKAFDRKKTAQDAQEAQDEQAIQAAQGEQ